MAMADILLHNINILIRIIFYSLWIWIFYFDGLHLSGVMRSFINCLVLADVVTWLMYQIYLLPRMVVQFGIGTVVNIVVMVLLYRDMKSLVPESMDMQAMAIMVFFSVAAVKGFYYLLIEMGYIGRQA
jgi:hypothetical protein